MRSFVTGWTADLTARPCMWHATGKLRGSMVCENAHWKHQRENSAGEMEPQPRASHNAIRQTCCLAYGLR